MQVIDISLSFLPLAADCTGRTQSLAGGLGSRRNGSTCSSASSIAAPIFSQRGGLHPTAGSGTLSVSLNGISSVTCAHTQSASDTPCQLEIRLQSLKTVTVLTARQSKRCAI